MSDDEPELLETKLTLSLGATIGVGHGDRWQDWVRPAASFSMKWAGIPNEEQVRLATRFISGEILNPILESVIAEAQARLTEVRNH